MPIPYNKMVSKAQTKANAVITPNWIDAFFLVQVGAKLLDMFKVKGKTYYSFANEEIERTADSYAALQRRLEREVRERQTVHEQAAELNRRLKAWIADAVVRSRR